MRMPLLETLVNWFQDLLTRLHHHNGTARTEALRELKEMLLHHSPETLHSELGSLLRGIAALSLDKEKNIRKDSLCALCLIFEHISKEKLMPYLVVLTSYLNCAMTHINPRIKEDSLYFLDILLLHCGNMLMQDSHKILSNFLDMICKLRSDKKKSRQLMIITSCESTTMKWRIQVLKRLVNMFNCILVDEKLDNAMCSSRTSQEVKHYIRYLPIYSNNSMKNYEIDFNKDADSVIKIERTSFTEEFIKYMDTLIPLMFDIWFEVCPDEKLENYIETTISSDASVLLKSVVEIIQLIIDYIDTLNQDDYNYKRPFIDRFYKSYMKNFMSKFPYGTAKGFSDKSRKCQEDYVEMKFNSNNCLQQNLGLCRIHAWFTSLISHNRKFHQTIKSYCISVIQYLNGMYDLLTNYIIFVPLYFCFIKHFFSDTIKNWCASDGFALSQLTKLLRTLFLSASSTWHANDIDLSQTLELIIKVSFHLPKDELQSDLFLIIGNIMLDCNLSELYR